MKDNSTGEMVYLEGVFLILAAWATVCYGSWCSLGSGFYPDTEGCTSFYSCINSIAVKHVCQGITVYKPGTNICVPRTPQDQCYKFNCMRKYRKKTTYQGDPTLYATCENDKAVEIHKCENYLSFNEKTQACELQCLGEGPMVNPDSCQSYFECIRTRKNDFLRVQITCSQGMWFNRESNKCEKETDPPECKPGTNSASTTAKIIFPNEETTVTPTTTPDPSLPDRCLSDSTTCPNCSMIRICQTNASPIYSECPERHYCDPEQSICQTNISVCHKFKPEKPFHCTSDGFFPALDSCSEFHWCNNKISRRGICPQGTLFDPRSSLCRSEKNLQNCTIGFNCTELLFGFSVHPLDSRYYALCINEQPNIVKKCPDGKVFDLANRYEESCTYEECEVNEQLRPVNDDCTKYLDCSGIADNKPLLVQCPFQFWFNPRTNHCEAKGDNEPEECKNTMLILFLRMKNYFL